KAGMAALPSALALLPISPSAQAAELLTSLSLSLSTPISGWIASLASGPIVPSDRAADLRTLTSESLSTPINGWTACLFPGLPSATAAQRRVSALGLFRSANALAVWSSAVVGGLGLVSLGG